MEYIIILLEGVITFISPCMLPLLPVYISYFAGQGTSEKNNLKTLFNVLSFIVGFTVIFTLFGVFSASLGILFKRSIKILNIILGIIVVLFGLNFMGIIKLDFINKSKGIKIKQYKSKYLSSFIFGIIFSITWTPCVGAFLGAALSMVTISGKLIKGIGLILTYCIGLGIPFLISAFLIDRLLNTFNIIKKHYKVINIICGIFLCILGILMLTGLMNKYFILVA